MCGCNARTDAPAAGGKGWHGGDFLACRLSQYPKPRDRAPPGAPGHSEGYQSADQRVSGQRRHLKV